MSYAILLCDGLGHEALFRMVRSLNPVLFESMDPTHASSSRPFGRSQSTIEAFPGGYRFIEPSSEEALQAVPSAECDARWDGLSRPALNTSLGLATSSFTIKDLKQAFQRAGVNTTSMVRDAIVERRLHELHVSSETVCAAIIMATSPDSAIMRSLDASQNIGFYVVTDLASVLHKRGTGAAVRAAFLNAHNDPGRLVTALTQDIQRIF